ncbi:MAG: phosphate signaling complex protein PhoU [Gammaproteobacteria bacterium]|nr:phosphate signaling complex protein PhoU [Gammaproteobacteria bacterium]
MSDKPGCPTDKGHILSRFDGDLGRFREIVLDMGRRVQCEVDLAADALARCDVTKARKVTVEHRRVRDLDIDALEANARLYAIHQPVARDLRFVLTLSRAVYDLERISGEALRVAEIAEALYEIQPSSQDNVIFEDVRRMHKPVADLLDRCLRAVAEENVQIAVGVALDGKELGELFKASIRRLATYLMEDPRNIRLVIDATLGIKAMERIGDHACSIARNLIYSVTGKDVRHVNVASLDAG